MLKATVLILLQATVLCLAGELLPFPAPLPALNISALPGLAKLNALVTNSANLTQALPALPPLQAVPTPPSIVPCTCGVFLTGQFTRGSHRQPDGFPALLHEHDTPFPCTPAGNKQCANKCLEVIARHLPHSGTIICGSIDRDCYKERAYLWTKNCNDVWVNSNMSAGREFCCKDGEQYKCPLSRP